MAGSEPKKYSRPSLPTSMTPERTQLFYAALKTGTPVELAASVAGIPHRTLYNWLKRGRESEDESNPYYQFYMATEQAKGHIVHTLTSVVLEAVRAGDGHLALKALNTYYPQYFGPNAPTAHLQGDEEPIDLAKVLVEQSLKVIDVEADEVDGDSDSSTD